MPAALLLPEHSTRGAAALPCPLPAGTWVATSLEGAPEPTRPRLAAWTGSRLLVVNQNGQAGLFDVCANRWSRVSTEGLPPFLALYGDRLNYPPVTVGSYVVFLFEGNDGSLSASDSKYAAVIYDMARDRWSVAPTRGAPAPRPDAIVAGTGREVIVWGGRTNNTGGRELGDGARLDPATGRWRPISKVHAPSPRTAGRAAWVWTGTHLVIWGGGPGSGAGDGALYDPRENRWTAISSAGAPSNRSNAFALVRGRDVVVWGGEGRTDGGVLDVQKNSWRSIPPAPEEFREQRFPRAYRVYLDGSHLVVVSIQMRAATFDLAEDRWTIAQGHTPPFTGMLPDLVTDDPSVVIQIGCRFAGGTIPSRQCLQTGWIARVNVAAGQWEAVYFPEQGEPPSVVGALTLWTGDRVIVWGGFEVVPDPEGRNGCEGALRPCDPVARTKQVFRREGGMFRPAFGPTR